MNIISNSDVLVSFSKNEISIICTALLSFSNECDSNGEDNFSELAFDLYHKLFNLQF